MKQFKVIFIALFALVSFSSACVCADAIVISYTEFTKHITQKLEAQGISLDTLNKSIEANIQNLASQNTLLSKELALLQKEALQSKELLFLLKQRNHLK